MANDLGEFLRARRADPGLGLPGARRRVPGLRREEVSIAAGISVDYYTRLEQGRETHPSDAVVDALARALRLDPDATRHLSRLRGARVVPPHSPERDEQERNERMAQLVEAVRPNAAYVLDRLSTMIAANTEGLALYDGFADIAPGLRNTCRYLLTDPRARDIFVEWKTLARGAVAQLRAANTDHLDDLALRELVDELSAASSLFRGWWADHIVAHRRTSITHIRTAAGVTTARRYEVLHLPEDAVRLTLWLPGLSSHSSSRLPVP